MNCLTSIDIENLSDILNIITQANRLQIVCLLNKNEEMCVCKIIEKLGIKQNLASHHLNLLKNIWLLKSRREWKNIFYSIDKIFYEDLQKKVKCIFNI